MNNEEEVKNVQFQINEGQKIRGIKSKSLYTSEKEANLWESLGIGVIIIKPDPFAGSILSDKKEVIENDDNVHDISELKDSLTDGLLYKLEPKTSDKKNKRGRK